jgi:hypothetical protein
MSAGEESKTAVILKIHPTNTRSLPGFCLLSVFRVNELSIYRLPRSKVRREKVASIAGRRRVDGFAAQISRPSP